MCGIAGWYSWSSARPEPEIIRGLLLANMERGTSATGMAWQQGKKIRIRKQEGPASEFILKQPEGTFEEVAASPRGLLHARATTKGSEKENANNHPVFGLGWLAVHNGTIHNDDELWRYYTKKESLRRFAEVDTSAIPLLLSRGTDAKSSIQQLSLLAGSATIAAWNQKQSDQIVLARFGHNDLLLFLDEAKEILYWSSAGAAAFLMAGKTIGRHKFITMSKLSDDYAMLLTPEGIDHVQTFKVTRSPFVWRRKEVTDTRPATTTHKETGNRGQPNPTTSGDRPGGSSIAVNFSNISKFVSAARVVWTSNPTNNVPTLRPMPLQEAFVPDWHGMLRCKYTLERFWVDSEPPCESTYEFPTAYGRWCFTLPKYVAGQVFDSATVMESRVFRPYKRTKEWWHRAYRLKPELPAPFELVDTGYGHKKNVTMFDEHLAWEGYRIERVLHTGSTSSSPGYLCPWCGVARSAIDIEHEQGWCEFCNIISEIPGTIRRRGEVD